MYDVLISIAPDGRLTTIYGDNLLPLMAEGESSTRRASHVEPDEDGTGWHADLSPVGGPVLTGFDTRRAALDAEVDYIERFVL